MVLADGEGTPLGAYSGAAPPAEVTLLDQTFASQPIWRRPQRLIADSRNNTQVADQDLQ